MHWSFARAIKDRRIQIVVGVTAALAAAYLAGRPLLRIVLTDSASATANASVRILDHPLDLIPTQGIVFGPVVRPSVGANSVTMGADGATLLAGRGDAEMAQGLSHPAAFAVTGAPNTVYSVSRTLTLGAASGPNMRLGALRTNTGSPGVISPSGTQQVRFGASFLVNPFTPPPLHDDTLQVIIAFN